jgi:hypothetical protein
MKLLVGLPTPLEKANPVTWSGDGLNQFPTSQDVLLRKILKSFIVFIPPKTIQLRNLVGPLKSSHPDRILRMIITMMKTRKGHFSSLFSFPYEVPKPMESILG